MPVFSKAVGNLGAIKQVINYFYLGVHRIEAVYKIAALASVQTWKSSSMTNALPASLSVFKPTVYIMIYSSTYSSVLIYKWVSVQCTPNFLVSSGNIQAAIRFAKQAERHFAWNDLLDQRCLDIVTPAHFKQTHASWSDKRFRKSAVRNQHMVYVAQ